MRDVLEGRRLQLAWVRGREHSQLNLRRVPGDVGIEPAGNEQPDAADGDVAGPLCRVIGSTIRRIPRRQHIDPRDGELDSVEMGVVNHGRQRHGAFTLVHARRVVDDRGASCGTAEIRA